jgi:hypothetical protein
MRNDMAVDAAKHRLGEIADSCKRLSAGLKARHPDIRWRALGGLPVAARHGPRGCWEIVTQHLPALDQLIEHETTSRAPGTQATLSVRSTGAQIAHSARSETATWPNHRNPDRWHGAQRVPPRGLRCVTCLAPTAHRSTGSVARPRPRPWARSHARTAVSAP